MTKHYEDNHTTIYNDDCRAILPDLDYTVAFTSPPYNMNLRVNAKQNGYISRGTAQSATIISKKYNTYTDDLAICDYYNMCETVLQMLLEKCRLVFWNVQSVTGNKPAIMQLFGAFAKNTKEMIIWDKQQVAPSANPHVMNSRFEYIWILAPEKDCFTRSFDGFTRKHGGFDNVISLLPMGKSIKEHGATMPVQLPQTLLQHFASTADTVIDPFMGSGTTLRAAKNLNMQSIGIEIDKQYCETAKKRLAQEVLPL